MAFPIEQASTSRLFPPLIKWPGSKRTQAKQIVGLFPKQFKRYYEPFVGGGSVLFQVNPRVAICGDTCIPLVNLWRMIQEHPLGLLEHYRVLWHRLQTEGYQVYYEVRERFNRTQNPADLFFLSRTCVNGLIRFNQNGEFNNSLHHTRRGIHPDRLAAVLALWLPKLQNVTFVAGDYEDTLRTAEEEDFVYLDPPYFYTKGRYQGRIDYYRFYRVLEGLNAKGVQFALSFDGYRGNKQYIAEIPSNLYRRRVELESGYSSFKKVMDGSCEMVRESVYLNW
jgi:DNA adenine methylase